MGEVFSSLSDEQLKLEFERADSDQSGGLDTFELKNLLDRLLDKNFSSTQIQSLLDKYDADGNGILDEEEWLKVARDAEAMDDNQNEAVEGEYEVIFEKLQLGFSVKNGQLPNTIVVSKIKDSLLDNQLFPGDEVVALNGVKIKSLRSVKTHEQLAEEIKKRSNRPLLITFKNLREMA